MNKSYIHLKRKAILLRKSGLSYGSIAKKLGISKSTASLWLYAIKLNYEQRKNLYSNQVKHLNTGENSQRNRRAREVNIIINEAKTKISKKISLESYRLFGTALYWAEGSKNKMFHMTNSDPSLIVFWVKWLKKIFNIQPNILKVRLNIYPQQSEKLIRKFWSELTNIPMSNFGKSYIKPLSNNYKKNNLYYGTVRIEVPKSTNYRYMVYAWRQRVIEGIAPNIKLVEKRWEKLRKFVKPVNMR
ncbi:hypothetical protein A2917_01715 [Candidatus Nomurabacteria bacterium RIFCSPLOWO2_01_FULL_42_17]|uniref:Uncharacterized protein n=1 Tax=Candidatus Nomurabacteria bacterium RIFCSPLOWO2_01_FULL_42_17 TaxID=1801780 RepID=A0A1F6XLR6_9BACT|nr:MAG: hypothetical protein A2917_01715 [Candidatus Nomurabacteria bacterium RIFCSPLOWO2_01_FULL_42_17]